MFQAGTLDRVAISSSRRSSWPRGGIHISYIVRRILYLRASREALPVSRCLNYRWTLGYLSSKKTSPSKSESNLKLEVFALRSDQSLISASKMKLPVIPKMQESVIEVGIGRVNSFYSLEIETQWKNWCWGFPFGANWLRNDFWLMAFWIAARYIKWKCFSSHCTPSLRWGVWSGYSSSAVETSNVYLTCPFALMWLTILSVSLSWKTLTFKFLGTLTLSTLISWFFPPPECFFQKYHSLPAEFPCRCEPGSSPGCGVSSVLAFSGSPKAALLPPGTREKCLRCPFPGSVFSWPLSSPHLNRAFPPPVLWHPPPAARPVWFPCPPRGQGPSLPSLSPAFNAVPGTRWTLRKYLLSVRLYKY